MYKTLTIFILAFALSAKTSACLNGEMRALTDGTFLYEDRDGNVPYGHAFITPEDEDIARMDSLYAATKDLAYLSDKGLLLILQEKYDEAIKLYLEIEKIQPNRYSTASNLGTAYELAGQNENALKWIRKSVEIDPKSHKNSEWIHVKILEAKIRGEQLYTSDFLLNQNFGTGTIPESNLNQKELQNLSDALYYQLNERVSFVKPKEKIVAQLLFDLGNIAFLLRNFNDAVKDYEQAQEYGLEGQLITNRLAEAGRLSKIAKPAGNALTKNAFQTKHLLGIFALLILVIPAFIIYKRKKNSRST